MSRFIAQLLNLLYPEDVACFACNRPANLDARGLCERCAQQIQIPQNPPCPDNLDGFCAGLQYDEVLHYAMHRFKYENARYLARAFAACITLPENILIDVIIPVPLHPRRQKERSYNQSALLAHALGGRIQLPVEETLLARTRETNSQTLLSREMRMHNVQDAFCAKPQAKGHRVLLVDDVCTTGSTLCACAQALRQEGATTVFAACACIALEPHASA